MPINPITLDKIEPIVIDKMGNKVIDRIVHEIKGAEIQKENKNSNNLNYKKQQMAAEKFGAVLSKYGFKFEYSIFKKKVRVKIKDKDGKTIIETEVDDMEELLDNIIKDKGSIIDVKG
jgi:hypothetical protein